MKATIVTIGDEILIGQIVDTNSGFIAKALDKIGVETVEMLSISDKKQHILDTFSNLQNKVDLVIITGGLGPTKDDITKHTFCEYFDDVLVVNQQVLSHVTQIIEGIYKRPITQLNKDQALVPSKCEVLFNKVGTAPGMWMKNQNTVYISLPGVPYEMKYLVENEIIPKVVKEYKRPYIVHRTILTYGQGESMIAERIENWENKLPEFIKLAYLPSPGKVRLRLTARGKDEQILLKAIEENVQSLTNIIGDIIVGFDENETIEVVIGKLLTQQGKTISTAESCSGGKIAQMLTSVAGSSAYFRGSVVSYATDIKTSVLGVDAKIIDAFSVVSSEVAKEMALGVQKLMKTDYAIATTGNAGPTSEPGNAEVGTVYIALATPNRVFVEEFNFGQPREKVIDRTSNKALEIVQKEILKNAYS
ncbi:CinA family nicotinamide mononucleotide deamidase-related protein [Flavobacterium sp.]|uniref:CinA family nicotinamide mononucleotide deamidase-related protein n=1 Tax=Flavobacterium sp. TaxID=239 RepID=UPI002489B8FE|nr:CinA family nicotinamide mononucleotide deamidase-related protein [Flavobacterium sp.]MDI1317249.1 CinA family nicotinamide mononucleotide deamidase-related protein [Flavobacterium sp.]